MVGRGIVGGVVLGAVLFSCQSNGERGGSHPQGVADVPWAAPSLETAVSVRDGRTGERLSLDELFDGLETADAVFLGEMHHDETTHRLQLAVLDELIRRRGSVVLAMEMFERDVQPHLDAYLAGEMDEEAFLQVSRPWGNYPTAYRPLVERAKQAGQPVVASNFPRPLRQRMQMEGADVLQSLEGEEAAWAPAELFPNPPLYHRRTDNAIRGHLGMMPPRSEDDLRLDSTQTLWDNAMGDACAQALVRHPGSSVLHVNGGFHSAYWSGTVHQFQRRAPDASVKTVAMTPTSHPAVAELSGEPVADYVVFVESRARDRNDGAWSVNVTRSIDYHLHQPDIDGEVPLLIWLVDDGVTAKEGLALWRDRIGDEAAILAVEPLHRERGLDLAVAGRWFWDDDFSEDLGAAQTALERAWGYAVRHFDLDPTRVCVAGEGTGATVAVAGSLFTDRLQADTVALNPRRYVKLKDLPLPLPELQGDDEPPQRSLDVVCSTTDGAWWKGELEQYETSGLPARLHTVPDDAWDAAAVAETMVRERLSLGMRESNGSRVHVVGDALSPRGRLWARRLADRAARDAGGVGAVVGPDDDVGASSEVTVTPDPRSSETTRAIPLCPGAFGGTTVLVLPESTSTEDEEAWIALEEQDPLSRRSRFHRLRIVTGDGERTLSAMLATLDEEQRRNVLIVPAVFCADGDWLRALHTEASDAENTMTLQWSPGLGASLAGGS